MTLAFNTKQPMGDALHQVSVGLPDILATLSAANSVWGWVNGLDSVKYILSRTEKDKILTPKILDALGVHALNISPVNAVVFTNTGAVHCYDKGIEDAFSGDERTQLVGTTICALAHELGDRAAAELFMKYLGPIIFADAKETREHLHGQIMECMPRIMNEGAARGFTKRFVEAISRCRIPSGEGNNHREAGGQHDLRLVAGLLIWISKGVKGTYFTRSSRVLRVAACLAEVGYPTKPCLSWHGDGEIPDQNRSGSLVLVLGGSMATDSLADDVDNPSVADDYFCIYHYRLKTAGAMFCNAFNDNNNMDPEPHQNTFENIYYRIKEDLSFVWGDTLRTSGNGVQQNNSLLQNPISPSPVWKPSSGHSRRSTLTSMASIHFPKSASNLWAYYGYISDVYLSEIREYENSGKAEAVISDCVIDHRIITASIIIAVISRLVGDGFGEIRHSCRMFLNTPEWLRSMADLVDEILGRNTGSVELWKVVCAVAVVHAGACYGNHDSGNALDYSRVVGWRNGSYAVLPRLLENWTPTEHSLGLQCIDIFWANAVSHTDGSIHSAETPPMQSSAVSFDSHTDQSLVSRVAFAGPPTITFPQDTIYLSLERNFRVANSDIGFCGRVNGDSVGFVGILEVLGTIARSIKASRSCQGHSYQPDAYNVQTRDWCKHRTIKPIADGLKTLISAKNDPLWTIFLAGNTGLGLSGSISYGCFSCASRELGDDSFVVGYH